MIFLRTFLTWFTGLPTFLHISEILRGVRDKYLVIWFCNFIFPSLVRLCRLELLLVLIFLSLLLTLTLKEKSLLKVWTNYCPSLWTSFSFYLIIFFNSELASRLSESILCSKVLIFCILLTIVSKVIFSINDVVLLIHIICI